MEYKLYPTSRDILHFGKGHEDNPPGRGSGRFAFGSGKRPHQHVLKNTKSKEDIVKSAKASDILAIQSDLATNELQDAVNRVRLNEELKGYNAKQIQTKWQKVDRMMKAAGDVVKWTDTGIKMWNQFAAIYNASIKSGDTKVPLPTVEYNKKSGDGKKDKN